MAVMPIQPKNIISPPEHFPEITSGAVLFDDRTLLTGHDNGSIVRWNLDDGSFEILFKGTSPVETLAVSPQNEVAVGYHSGLLFIFPAEEPRKQKVIQDATYSRFSRVWRISWVDSNRFIATSTYGTINLFKRGSDRNWSSASILGHSHSVFGIELSDTHLATGDYRGNVKIWRESGESFDIAFDRGLSRKIEAVAWQNEGGLAVIDASGGITFFEKGYGEQWRSVFQTATATGRGTSLRFDPDGNTLYAGTDGEVIQVDLESYQIQQIPVARTLLLFIHDNLVYALTTNGLITFAKEKIEVAAKFVRYKFAKVSVLGRTNVGKTTLCRLITTGSADNVQSTYGRNVWDWIPPIDSSIGPRRVIFLDHGGQEAVMETFLPTLSDSDLFLDVYMQRDSFSFEVAEKILAEISAIRASDKKVIFVNTHIDDKMNVIDDDKVNSLLMEGKIVANKSVSGTTKEGLRELEETILQEISWKSARFMIEAQDVDKVSQTIDGFRKRKEGVVSFDRFREVYEDTLLSKISKYRLRFLLQNFSDQGIIEYYPEVKDTIIIADEEYNTLKTKIPVEAEHKGGVVDIREIYKNYSEYADYVRILDEFYASTGVAIRNQETRIFPRHLKPIPIDMPEAFKSIFKNPAYSSDQKYSYQEMDIARLLSALVEMKLTCNKASTCDGLFSYGKNAAVYYTIKEGGDAMHQKHIQICWYVAGEDAVTCTRLNDDFKEIITKLYGTPIQDESPVKKKEPRKLKFDVALSFASEQRDYVRKVAEVLEREGIKVFYDEFKVVDLWGLHMAEKFKNVYYAESLWCMMFISKEYVNKAWPNQEREFAIDREVEQMGGYILPVRFDDTEVPGLSKSVSYLRAKDYAEEELANIFIQKHRNSILES
jgi:GTPase SAR1 family protein